MASPDDGAATPGYEPAPRYGHALVSHNGLTYLVGGLNIDLTSVDVFNPTTLKWQCQQTTGDTPAELFRMAHAKAGTLIYFFGGGGCWSLKRNAMTTLHLETLRWERLQPQHAPSPRVEAKMISDGERLYLFGGKDDSNRKLTDLHIFSIKDGECCETALGTPLTSC